MCRFDFLKIHKKAVFIFLNLCNHSVDIYLRCSNALEVRKVGYEKNIR